jgi:hypothetical protein
MLGFLAFLREELGGLGVLEGEQVDKGQDARVSWS